MLNILIARIHPPVQLLDGILHMLWEENCLKPTSVIIVQAEGLVHNTVLLQDFWNLDLGTNSKYSILLNIYNT